YFQAANFQLLNPLFIMILTPIFVALWNSWKKQPTAPTKFAVGLGFAGLSYLVMAIPGALFGTSGRVSPLWLVLSWFIVEIGEMLISPIGLSVTTQLSPKVFKTQMMSLWYLSDAVAQAINAQIIRFYTPKTEVNYFIAVGIVSIVFGILLLFGVKKISALMGDSK
ncbi:MAG: peptide ABC transporter permease, partial [Lactobacillus iners]|nr:peptide ABC transporter permease [Lactobacillus iners]